MDKQTREMQRYESHLAACRASLKDAVQHATEVAKRSGATIHPRVAAIKKTAVPAVPVME